MHPLIFLEQRSLWFWIVLDSVLIAVVGGLDYLTGHELDVSLFYLAPIAGMAWFKGWRWGSLVSVISVVVLLSADLTSQVPGIPFTSYYWNTGIRLGFFIIVALLLSVLHRTMNHESELARLDYVTGAANERYFYERARLEIDRAKRYKHPFTLAYLDLDNFKTINDRWGHLTGDQVLRAVVDGTGGQLRSVDMIARVGGDEFVLLLPETDAQAASAAIPRIRSSILAEMEKHQWPVTFSIGVLTSLETAQTPDDLIHTADDLMYSVKKSGKNAIAYAVAE